MSRRRGTALTIKSFLLAIGSFAGLVLAMGAIYYLFNL